MLERSTCHKYGKEWDMSGKEPMRFVVLRLRYPRFENCVKSM